MIAALLFLSCFESFLNWDLFDIIDLTETTSLLSAFFPFDGLRREVVSISLSSSSLLSYKDSSTFLMIVFLNGIGSSLHSSEESSFFDFLDEDLFLGFFRFSLSSSLVTFDSSSDSETYFFFFFLLPPSNYSIDIEDYSFSFIRIQVYSFSPPSSSSLSSSSDSTVAFFLLFFLRSTSESFSSASESSLSSDSPSPPSESLSALKRLS